MILSKLGEPFRNYLADFFSVKGGNPAQWANLGGEAR